MGSTRWCPTPEQLMILEHMYRTGVRTPNATKIQQITANLSRYGRIEGKNVFYWFQNHKARERQKLRKKMMINNHLVVISSKQQWRDSYYQQSHMASLQQFCCSCCSSTISFLPPPQGKAVEEDSSNMMMMMNNINYHDTWQLGVHPREEGIGKKKDKISDKDHLIMMMMDVGPTITPIKTFQLFPMSSTPDDSTSLIKQEYSK